MSRIILDVLFNKTFMARVSNSRRSEEEEDERRASDSLLCNQWHSPEPSSWVGLDPSCCHSSCPHLPQNIHFFESKSNGSQTKHWRTVGRQMSLLLLTCFPWCLLYLNRLAKVRSSLVGVPWLNRNPQPFRRAGICKFLQQKRVLQFL